MAVVSEHSALYPSLGTVSIVSWLCQGQPQLGLFAHGYSAIVMNSRLRALGGRINNIRASELPKEKTRSEIICNVHFLDGSVQSFKVNLQTIEEENTGSLQAKLLMCYRSEKGFLYLILIHFSKNKPGNFCLMFAYVNSKCVQASFPISQLVKLCFIRLSCPISSAVVLASYAVQSQLGDYNASVHRPGYLSNYKFIPEQNKDFLNKVESLHEQHSGLKQSEAESCYINIARTLEFYGVELHSGRDLHNLDLMIGIASSGIAVYRKLICTSFYPWRSPRLRHEIRKPRHSSVDNLTNEISYITETEDVFYTYKGSPTSKDSDSEFSQNRSPQRRNVLGNSPVQRPLTHISPKAFAESPNGVGNISGSYPLEGVDKQFLETYDNITKSNSTEDSSQYYCDKNDVIEGDLLLVRIIPDEDGKFGFNLKADKCIPKLNEGDQIVLINGRDISEHTHDQVVMFIKASRESHTRELALLVRRKVKQFVEPKSEDEADSHNLPESLLPVCSQYGGDTLDESMEQLRKGLESGTVLIQFEHNRIPQNLPIFHSVLQQLYRKKPGLAVTCAKVPQNMDKNRYKDVLPYDATRIILQGDEDYINANYVNMEIPSVGIVNRYIATQGPLPHTCAHFWQVVWDHKLSLIIMLTTLTERGRTKCHQYWPDPPDVMEYGSFRVRCHSEDCTIAYVVREMVITKVETEQQHTVTHLQYVAWPDHGVPDDSMDFLEFVNCMRPKRVENEPVLVHCSAGIGRTGVLVTMETAMCLIERNQPVYPLDIVRKMRDQRAMMVQTSSQYKFVCEAILRVYKEGLVRPLDSS
ncbi:Ptpn3 [Columba guinea]|nr:Ptpn3 [Columba guinea]